MVFSAHWQGEVKSIHVNKEEETDLIYEYVLQMLEMDETRHDKPRH